MTPPGDVVGYEQQLWRERGEHALAEMWPVMDGKARREAICCWLAARVRSGSTPVLR